MKFKAGNRFGGRLDQLDDYRKWGLLVRQQTRKRLITQLREIRGLKSLGGQCGISDYYWYKLYDDSYQLGRGAKDFVGWRLQQQLSLALNPRNAVLPAWDKYAFMVIANAAGLPVAPVLACFHPAKRISETLGIHLKTRAAVSAYLRNPSIYPLFGKPAYSQQGYGAACLDAYDATADSIRLLDGRSISLDCFLKRLDETVDHRYHKPECGFLFQESFRPAPEIQALTNWPAICSVRVICLNGPDGVQPIRAVWKIAVPPNHVDNFSLGKYGNMLANVDLASGEVSRVVAGLWPTTRLFEQHPFSEQSMAGFKLPEWTKILEICQRAGSVFPLMKIHHWDFALTDRGPMILELNDLGGTEIAQVHGQGLLTDETRQFLKRYGNSGEQPWINGL